MSNLEQVQEELGWDPMTGAHVAESGAAESETDRRIWNKRPSRRVLAVAALVAFAVGVVAVALALLGGSDAGEADGGVAVAAAVDEAPAVQPAAQPPAEVASEAIVVARTVSPAPTLEVNIPRPGSLVTQPWVVLVGATEPGTFVAVGAQEADVAVDGRWTLGLALQEGANRITVTATDRTGQFTQNTFTVYFEKGAETPAGSPPAAAVVGPAAERAPAIPSCATWTVADGPRCTP